MVSQGKHFRGPTGRMKSDNKTYWVKIEGFPRFPMSHLRLFCHGKSRILSSSGSEIGPMFLDSVPGQGCSSPAFLPFRLAKSVFLAVRELVICQGLLLEPAWSLGHRQLLGPHGFCGERTHEHSGQAGASGQERGGGCLC